MTSPAPDGETSSAAASSADPFPIPSRINIALALLTCASSAGLLVAASRAGSWPPRLLLAVAFAYVNNTVFSLLHEAVHGVFSRRRLVNDGFGLVLAALFPTGFTFQRVCHLGHHRRNRSDAEMFELYTPEDNVLLKRLQLYGILTGLYWLLPPLGCLLYLVSPRLLRVPFLRRNDVTAMRHTGTDAMLAPFDGEVPEARIRLEILFSLLVQVSLVRLLDVTPAGWLTCYAAFALNWSSLQYADHAFSVRDVRDGAWNLRVNPLVQALFLNYHHHLAHHQRPEVPWIHLGRLVDRAAPRPGFLSIYLRMWRGPIPEARLPAATEELSTSSAPAPPSRR